MRTLSPTFMDALKAGFLSELTKEVASDFDLDLEIRKDYINLYYKGNSLLKLEESHAGRYKTDINEKFRTDLCIPSELVDQETTTKFINAIPAIKRNILRSGRHSIEAEYEQLIIRANNFEPHNNSEYFLFDRQYVVGKERFDLTGFYWPRDKRVRGQVVPMCLMEVKFALNKDITEVHEQLERYYHAVEPRAAELAAEAEEVFHQKIDLGLYDRSPRRNALRTLKISPDLDKFQCILVLVDYNPNSMTFDCERLSNFHLHLKSGCLLAALPCGNRTRGRCFLRHRTNRETLSMSSSCLQVRDGSLELSVSLSGAG
jgi:hypothetical protein